MAITDLINEFKSSNRLEISGQELDGFGLGETDIHMGPGSYYTSCSTCSGCPSTGTCPSRGASCPSGRCF